MFRDERDAETKETTGRQQGRCGWSVVAGVELARGIFLGTKETTERQQGRCGFVVVAGVRVGYDEFYELLWVTMTAGTVR